MKKLLAILFAVTTLNTASASATEYIDISTLNMENTLQSDELIIKEKQLDAENDARSCEEQFKAEQLKEQVKDRYFKAGIAAAEIIIPIVFYSVWLKKGFKFEEKGIFTSTTFRSLWSKFKPRK